MRLIDADKLLKQIEKDKIELNIHDDGKSKTAHNGEYNHFLKRIHEQPVVLNSSKSIDLLTDILKGYFDIPNDTYAYNLIRVKSAFNVGTMSLDDFEEFTEETVDDIVQYIIDELKDLLYKLY